MDFLELKPDVRHPSHKAPASALFVFLPRKIKGAVEKVWIAAALGFHPGSGGAARGCSVGTQTSFAFSRIRGCLSGRRTAGVGGGPQLSSRLEICLVWFLPSYKSSVMEVLTRSSSPSYGSILCQLCQERKAGVASPGLIQGQSCRICLLFL